jgi:hypothetical protein
MKRGLKVAPPCAIVGAAALGLIKAEEEKTRRTGVRPASDITLETLFERYKRHQKARIRSTTFARLGGILDTLKAHLPERAKEITHTCRPITWRHQWASWTE